MADITLSAAVRNNLLSLQNTADLLGTTQERLATGKKVNSALDDPTAFFTASSLQSRAGDLNRLLDSVGLAIQTIEAADAGIKAITDLVESAQASARQALQTTGQTTTSEVTGAATAGFNPQSVTSIVGTGATATNADAAASVNATGIAADAASVTVTGTDLTATTTIASLTADNNQLDFNIGGTAYSVVFSDAATSHTVTGTTLTFDRDAAGASGQVSQLITELDGLFGAAATVTDAGDGAINIAAAAAQEFVRVTDNTGALTAAFNLGAVGFGDDATDRLATKNADLDEAAFNGDTLQVSLGGTNLGTVTFGTGANVSNLAELVSAVDGFTGVSATSGGTNLQISTTDTNDADSAIVLTGTDNNLLQTVLNFTPDAGGGSVTTASPTNLLSAGNGLTQGDTLTVTIGSQTTNITFGNNTGEVSTLRELNTALNAISAGSVSVAETGGTIGNISITNGTPGDSITIAGSTGTAARFGLTEGEFSNLVNGTSGPVQQGDTLTLQVGTNSALTVTFGTGANQVNTTAELTTALNGLTGGTATLDTTTGAITVTATTETDSITITDSATPRSAAAFGLLASVGTTAAVTTNSTERAALESEFNSVLDQIDQLARDASFNGNNLLQSDNLQVIFNEDGSSSLTVNGVDFDASGLGVNRAATNAFQTDANIDTTLTEISTAIRSLRTQGSTFGSNLSTVETREQFTKELSNVLETGAAGLTLADTNEEGANLLALQTRQQLSTVALSLASQNDQSVLRLF